MCTYLVIYSCISFQGNLKIIEGLVILPTSHVQLRLSPNRRLKSEVPWNLLHLWCWLIYIYIHMLALIWLYTIYIVYIICLYVSKLHVFPAMNHMSIPDIGWYGDRSNADQRLRATSAWPRALAAYVRLHRGIGLGIFDQPRPRKMGEIHRKTSGKIVGL